MNKNKIKTIAGDLIKVINGNSPLSLEGKWKKRFITYKGIVLNIIDEIADVFEAIIRNVLQEGNFGEKFTEKYIENKLLEVIKQCSEQGFTEDNFISVLENMIQDLESYNIEYFVITPTDGLKAGDVQELEIGQIKLFEMNKEKAAGYLDIIERVILGTKNLKEEQEILIERTREEFKDLLGYICSEYKVVAEPKRAIERAKQQTKLALEILGFGIPLLYSDNLNIMIGLKGDIYRTSRYVPVISEKNCLMNHEKIGSTSFYEMNKENINRLDEMNILLFSKILRKKNLNDFESSLLRSLHWFNSSLYQNDLENSFLNLITAIETLLTPRDGNPIGTAIAEGIVMILTTGLESRKNLKKEVQRLYRMRSAVSHGGNKEILDSDYKTLRQIVFSLIIELLNMDIKFESQQSLLSWIEEQKLR
jgi:hypothetical protein